LGNTTDFQRRHDLFKPVYTGEHRHAVGHSLKVGILPPQNTYKYFLLYLPFSAAEASLCPVKPASLEQDGENEKHTNGLNSQKNTNAGTERDARRMTKTASFSLSQPALRLLWVTSSVGFVH